MKAKYFIWMAAIALLSSCTNEDELLNDSLNKGVVSASIEGMDSRVGFEYANRTGQFFWSAGDAIGVYHGSKFHEYNLQGTGGESTGDFKAKETTISGASQLCALYPYNEQHSVSNEKVSFYMNTEYTYTNEDVEFGSVNGNPTNVPMLAKIATEGSNSFTFGHLGGALCFKFINVPVNASKLVFAANSKITGAFEVDATASDPKISTSESTTDNTVTISFTAKNEATTRVFYIPMPNGTYTGFSWKFLDSSSTELKSYTTTTAVNTITDGKLLTITYTLDASGTGNISSTASSLTELQNALASGDDNIQLTANIELTDDLNVSDDTTIDLNGQSLNTGDKSITVGEGKTLNLTNNSAAGALRSASTGITGTSDIIVASANSVINIGEGVEITNTAENCCVFIPSCANGVKLTTKGKLYTTGKDGVTNYATVYVNGNVTSGIIEVAGGSIKHGKDLAIYAAGKTDVSISGGTIEGTTGVEVRGGSLTISGGEIKGIGNPDTATPNANGSTTVGSAVAVSQHTTNHAITTTISGGTLTGINALYEADLQATDQVATDVTMSVTGGTFEGKVSSKSCANFITGGTFSDASAFDYLGSNADVTLGADMEITKAVTISDGISAAINLNGKTIENKTAGHPSMISPDVDDECVVFMVTNGTLTINGEGDVKATGDGVKSDYNVAVWVMGENAKAIINGGNYTNSMGCNNDGCDLIYGRNGAEIEINGGSFQSHIRSTLGGGTYDVLDCKDYKEGSIAQSTITVNGGKFQNYAPSYENVGANEVVLGTSKAVYNGETVITSNHDTSSTTDVWYEVK